jgi:glutamine synthetase adenylyltransferase
VESRLRIVTDRPNVEVPSDEAERLRLAKRLGHDSTESMQQQLDHVMSQIRTAFDRLLQRS